MKMKTLATIALLVMLPMSAGAGSWLKNCRSGATTTALQIGDAACYQPASNSDDSVLINVDACENFSLRWFLDRNGDTTASTVTPTVRSCPMGLAAANSNACWILQNVTFDGSPATGNEAVYGGDAWTVYVDMPGSGTIADPQMDLKCGGPKN
jgi:hypothetical protein